MPEWSHEIEGLLGSRPRVFAFNPGRVKAHMRTAGREVAEKLRVDVQHRGWTYRRPVPLGS